MEITKTKKNKKQPKGFGLAFLASFLTCSCFAFFASNKTWPPLDGDAPAYFSPAIEFSQGRGLVNQVWLPPLDDSIDGPGGRRYIYHGFIYPLVIGWLGKASGGGAAVCLGWMHLFNVLAALVAAWGVIGFCRLDGAFKSILAFCLPLAFFALCEALAGRPEPAVFLWFGLGLVAMKKAPAFCPALLPFLATLVLFSSPAVGVLAFVLLVAFRLSQKTDIHVKEIAQGLGGALAAAGFSFLIYPYPAMDWIMGVWRHSRINLGLPQGHGFFSTWVTRAQNPLFILTFTVPSVLALWQIVRTFPRLSPFRGVIKISLSCIFLLGLVKIAFFKTEASYNAIVWIPLILAVSLHFVRAPLAHLVLAGSLLLPISGLARSGVILANQFNHESVTFQEVQGVISAKIKEGITVSPGLFLAVSNPGEVLFLGSDERKKKKSAWRIEQQSYRGIQHPPEICNFQLIENKFGMGANIFNVPISRTPGGWEYAIYKKSN